MSNESGAIDNEWDESEKSGEETMLSKVREKDHALTAGSVAIDLVTRQPLYIHEKSAEDIVEYYEREGFDLFSYKSHPYLPVSLDDQVFECVFIGNDPQTAYNVGKTYDFPEGRLMKVPLAEAWDSE